jgi:hypothetical protein
MHFEQFNRYGQEKQLDITMMTGVLLMECRRFNFMLRLFQVRQFYVEIYSMEESGEVIAINAFNDTDSLETYLEQIDIKPLLQPI